MHGREHVWPFGRQPLEVFTAEAPQLGAGLRCRDGGVTLRRREESHLADHGTRLESVDLGTVERDAERAASQQVHRVSRLALPDDGPVRRNLERLEESSEDHQLLCVKPPEQGHAAKYL